MTTFVAGVLIALMIAVVVVIAAGTVFDVRRWRKRG